ncbi:LINE-1 reverse transcriptase isogeny [Gossypium australe]|uniref:LINE-1 reverse transcriptase isogeny n=1 Tax=Gossypium australe TaxID=47621 RepID=A0A5B6X3K4_9ROSI|nr:LINE-1 reverse transcriptase isogeny [Gossypium australe]
MVNRLRLLMGHLTSPNQASFVMGPSIIDNIIVAQEVVHSLRTFKVKRFGMSMKINLEKAYDRIRWNFLEDTWMEARLPYLLVRFIIYYVSSFSLRAFTRNLTRGPIVDVFICSMNPRSKGDGNHFGCPREDRFSHTYSLLMIYFYLVKLTEGQACLINDLLNTFCHFFGSKSQIFFSPNVLVDRVNDICTLVGFKHMDNLGMHLGMPLFHERFGKKLNGCDAKRLSLAGRITLAKNVLLAIPNYFMGTVVIPISICREIDKLARKFIWGSNLLDRKPTLMDWEDCCHLVEGGELGLRNLVDRIKFGLRSSTKSFGPLVMVVRSISGMIFVSDYIPRSEISILVQVSQLTHYVFVMLWMSQKDGISCDSSITNKCTISTYLEMNGR